ncbi:unnamed protein product [Prorocentrum cordatum]|uniref:Uncharacterized protein n=1 Tax=Prorocentrum cordatum TaxID=2364126 RepID=A0ABN9V4P4_9DINO|nr:unnamed protein product [Polarella glacialis]
MGGPGADVAAARALRPPRRRRTCPPPRGERKPDVLDRHPRGRRMGSSALETLGDQRAMAIADSDEWATLLLGALFVPADELRAILGDARDTDHETMQLRKDVLMSVLPQQPAVACRPGGNGSRAFQPRSRHAASPERARPRTNT